MRLGRTIGRLFVGLSSFGCAIAAWAADEAPPAEPAASAASAPADGEAESRKSHSVAAFEIIGFDALVNGANRVFSGSDDYNVTLRSIRRNLSSAWVADNDPFKINQFAHPYQGSMYHGFARATGHSYWESAGFTFAGSVLWEIAGERTPPARNDQIASGIAGSFLGEPLFRMAHLVLEQSGLSKGWREAAAAAIHPSVGFNRLVFGEQFGGIFSSHGAAYYSRLQVGLSGLTQNNPGVSTTGKRGELLADFSMDYGLPGKPGYVYRRPFDHFSFQATGSSANVFENVMTRGLLVGRDYEAGPNVRGVWGLYGSYDYLAPQIYHLSSTALSIGTSAQWWMSRANAMQGTASAGIGYAAASTLRATDEERDYRYGLAPQAMLALRWIYDDRASLDLSAREYYVSRVAGNRSGFDNIVRSDASLTWRVKRQHGIAIKYLFNRRDTRLSDGSRRSQTRGTIGLYYVFLGQDGFGAVEWRD
jgi:hypothetical protein